MRARTSAADLASHAEDAVARAAREVGFGIESPGSPGLDLELRAPDGRKIRIEVKAMALGAVRHERPKRGVVRVLVADQISKAARDDLNREGIAWFDRRGHFRLVSDGVFIDADVAPQPRNIMAGAEREPIAGRSGLAAAAALLLAPDNALGVSEIARTAQLNPSSITRAMASLVDAHLAERRGRGEYRPLVPELFWALADVWPRERVSVRLGALHDQIELFRGAAAGVRGAIAWGAPLVATADYPSHLYVPDEQAIRRLVALSDGTGDEATLAHDLIGLITQTRYERAASRWPVAHPLFCALDLTASSRDREALEQWTPAEGFTRVW